MSQLTLEELELLDEPKYRNYINSIDKALKNFEYTSEWADLIAALGKLNKVLQSNTKFNVIPRRVVIAKRLAQCLHPALPSGVHLKALETYDLIFKLVGAARLSNELFIYSAGLYPLLAHAAINVRPSLLGLYETHLIPIAEYLKPGLSGFLNGVLPGLEEGVDHYDRTSSLLNNICQGVSPLIFYGCLWKCIADNSLIRLPAFTYILAHFNRKLSVEDQLEILGSNVDIMVHSLCASLEDGSVLVQRSALEFLLAAFPLHGTHLIHSDVVELLAAAVTAVLRRDMSLNRRLFAWLLGSEIQFHLLNQEHPLVKYSESLAAGDHSISNPYFQLYSKSFVIEALQKILKCGCSSQPVDLRPYRVLVSLLEKPEIGPMILDEILIDVFRALFLSRETDEQQPRQHEELIKTANLLFGTLEQCYIWSYCGRLLQSSCSHADRNDKVVCQPVGAGPAHFLEMCRIISFLLEMLSTDSSTETQAEHLPSLLLQTADLLQDSYGTIDSEMITAGLDLCFCLLKKIQPAHETEECVGSRSRRETDEASEVDSGEFHSPPSSPALISSSQHQKILIEKTMTAIKGLLTKLLNPGIFVDSRDDLLALANQLLATDSCYETNSDLEALMETCMNSSAVETCRKTSPVNGLAEAKNGSVQLELRLSDGDQLRRFDSVMKKCCSLLRELSSFPTYCAAVAANDHVDSQDGDWRSLPDWLQLLCLCCCSLRNSDCQLDLAATASLLDFTALTFSMTPTTYWKTGSRRQTPPQSSEVANDVFTVVLLPVISPDHLLILLNRSRVFQLLSQRLWEGVGVSATQLQCTEFLHQLHTLAPPLLENVAEDVVLASLSSEMQEEENSAGAAEKFVTLWHLGRDLEPSRWGTPRIRTFDRCLFLLLDWLFLNPAKPQRSLAEGWLIQSLLRNDLSRVLDPLLLKLLQPHSARISIRHVTVKPTKEKEIPEQDREDNIYAISSVNGHVIYHVTPTKTKAKSRSQGVRFNRSTLALGWQGKVAECFVAREVLFPWQLPQNQLMEQTVGLFVNPFPEDTLYPVRSVQSNPAAPEADSSAVVIDAILDELIDTVVSKAIAAAAASRSKSKEGQSLSDKNGAIHPLHNHLLLYCQVSDAQQTLHALYTLRNQLLCQPRLMLLSLSSTSLASSRSPHSTLIQELLARHRKCLFGNGFHGEVSGDWLAPYRSSMYLEVVLQLLLYHLRSFYSNLGISSLTRDEIMKNRQVQVFCVQLLAMLLNELLPLVRDSGKGFASYISDLLNRCRLQKVALHSILAMLHIVPMIRNKTKRNNNGKEPFALTEEIVLFNEQVDTQGSSYSELTLISLIKLLLSIMALEDQLEKQNGLPVTESGVNSHNSNGQTIYQRGLPVHAQPLFMTALLTALKQRSCRWLHTEFTRMLAASLPFLGRSLPALLNAVVPQICLNLESVSVSADQTNPPDYLVTELEALTALCHYVLIDSSNGIAPALAGSAGLLSGLNWGIPNGNSNSNGTSSNFNGQILHNLIHAFAPAGAGVILNTDAAGNDPYSTARRNLLSTLPRVFVCIGNLWQASNSNGITSEVVASRKRQKLLEFVSPIAHHHGVNFLAAVGVAWLDKKDYTSVGSAKTKIVPPCSPDQLAFVDLVSSVRVLPPDTLVQLLRQAIKQPPQVQHHNRNYRLEVALLHFFHAYLKKMNRGQLGECWASLLQLLREVATMAPPLLFAALAVFGEAVQRNPSTGEKRDQRELQEVASKLLEACGTVAAACLEQTTWLRRNLSVRRDLAVPAPVNVEECETAMEASGSLSSSSSDISNSETVVISGPVSSNSNGNSSKAAQYSIQALNVLAELLAPLQDLIFPSEDKEKVIPLLTALLSNVVPYLKHHSQANIAGMRAASQLLSSLSGFPATRRAWRKDSFDLLLDPAFFYVDVQTLRHWREIIDNLMSHDKDAFRELLNRVSVNPSGSLGLFSSKEQEIELRAMLLKRLAFALFCTEGDQYQRYLPDIQEKLSESLRLAQAWPTVQAQVFLCFRVLLLRTSQQHVTSLWPSVITETVTVLAQLEHELRRESEEFSTQIRRLSSLDSTWVTNGSNGLQGHAHPAWLHVYLATCKLLHLALTLPATRLPQFQMYRWAFVGDEVVSDGDIISSPPQQVMPTFVPYLSRIYKLLCRKAESCGIPLPTTSMDDLVLPSSNSMKSLMDLLPFFHAIEQQDLRKKAWVEAVLVSSERALEKDFLEPIPT